MVRVVVPGDLVDGVLKSGAIAIDSTPEQFQITAAYRFRIAGLAIIKAVATGIAMVAAKTINTAAGAGTFWGVFAVQINAAGTVTVLAPTNDQVHTTEALAIAALPSAASDNVLIGFITLESKTGAAWTSVTDSMSDDVTTANFTAVGGTSVIKLAAGVLVKDPVRLRAVRWVDYTASDKLELIANGEVIWEDVGRADLKAIVDTDIEKEFPNAITGFNVQTLESGRLYLYF